MQDTAGQGNYKFYLDVDSQWPLDFNHHFARKIWLIDQLLLSEHARRSINIW